MKKCALLLSIILTVISYEVKATHIMGSDITYKFISDTTYLIQFKVYRECSGAPLNGIAGMVSAGSNSSSISITKKGIKDITPNCKTTRSGCDQNPSISMGAEEHTFESIVNFNLKPYSTWLKNGLCEFTIGFGQCCRNTDITTIKYGGFYTEAKINLCNIFKTGTKRNNSPTFNDLPVFLACCNMPFYQNIQGFETFEKDSLSYELVTPLTSIGNKVTYLNDFSAEIPMTPKCDTVGKINCTPSPNLKIPKGFYFNKNNGDMVFTPSKCDEVGVTVIEIKEWRKDSSGKYLHIGTIKRDIQIYVIQCSNLWPPEIKSEKFNYSYCEGDTIKIDIEGKDTVHFLNPNGRRDTVSLFWSNNIPGAVLNIIDTTKREKQAVFEWVTKIGDARNMSYQFAVSAKDDACPINQSSSKAFEINIHTKSKGKTKLTQLCDKVEYSFTADSGYKNPTYLRWEIVDVNNDTIYSDNKIDTLKLPKLGKYYFKAFINPKPHQIVLLDTFELKSDTNYAPNITAKDTHFVVCAGDKLEFSIFAEDSLVKQGNPLDKVSLTLSDIDSNATFTLKNPNSKKKEGTFTWQTSEQDAWDTLYRFTAMSIDDFCPFPDTTTQEFTIRVSRNPKVSTALEETCNFFKFQTELDSSFDLPAKYDWKIWKDSLLFDSSKVMKDSLISKEDANYFTQLIVRNAYDCADTLNDTLRTFMSPASGASINLTQKCKTVNYNVQLKDSFNGPANYLWTVKDTFMIINTSNFQNDSFAYLNDSSYLISLFVKNKFNCEDTIYSKLKIPNVLSSPPSISIAKTHFEVCVGDTLKFDVDFQDLVNRQDTISVLWNNVPGADINLVRNGSRRKTLKFNWAPEKTDALDSVYKLNLISFDNACPKQDTTFKTITIKVSNTPEANITAEETCNQLKYKSDLLGKTDYPIQYKWEVYNNNNLFDTSISDNDSVLSKKDANYKLKLLITTKYGCRDSFSEVINTTKSPSSDAIIDLQGDCKKIKYEVLLKNNFNYPATYYWMIKDSTNQIRTSSYKSDSLNYQNDSTYIFTLLLKNKFNCIDTLSSKIKIDNGQNFPPLISSNKYHYEVCALDTLSFDVEVLENINVLDTINLNWTGFAGPQINSTRISSGDKKISFKWNPKLVDVSDSIYKLKIIAYDNACPKQDTSFKTITIKVNGLPSTKRKYNEYCGETAMVFESKPDSTVKKPIYHAWLIQDLNKTTLYSSTHALDTFKSKNVGHYISLLELKDSNQCKSYYMDTILLQHVPKIINLGRDTVISEEDSLLLKAGSEFTSYLWSDSSSDSTLLVRGNVIGVGDFNFWVETKDSLGCNYIDSISIKITSTIGIKDWNMGNLLLYPTPSSKEITLELPNDILSGRLKIMAMDGKTVLEKQVTSLNKKILLSIENLAAGMYMLKLSDGKNNYQAKFYKE